MCCTGTQSSACPGFITGVIRLLCFQPPATPPFASRRICSCAPPRSLQACPSPDSPRGQGRRARQPPGMKSGRTTATRFARCSSRWHAHPTSPTSRIPATTRRTCQSRRGRPLQLPGVAGAGDGTALLPRTPIQQPRQPPTDPRSIMFTAQLSAPHAARRAPAAPAPPAWTRTPHCDRS